LATPKEDGKGNTESVAVSGKKDLFPLDALGQMKLLLDRGTYISHFLDDIRIVNFVAAHIG